MKLFISNTQFASLSSVRHSFLPAQNIPDETVGAGVQMCRRHLPMSIF